jgi:hypothetical protein
MGSVCVRVYAREPAHWELTVAGGVPHSTWSARRPLQHPELVAQDRDLEILGAVVPVTPAGADEYGSEDPGGASSATSVRAKAPGPDRVTLSRSNWGLPPPTRVRTCWTGRRDAPVSARRPPSPRS